MAETYSQEMEIFAVGKWNGETFARADLEDIAANFAALGDLLKVPLKLGHDEKQPMTDGEPSLGWVERVWVEGDKLMARVTDMPEVVSDAIKARMYRSVSIELYFDVKHRGKEYAHVLRGVALLGSTLPAVNTLADLDAYLPQSHHVVAGRMSVFSAIGAREQPGGRKPPQQQPKGDDVDNNELSAKVAQLSEQMKTFTAEKKALEDQLAEKDKAIAERDDKLKKFATDEEARKKADFAVQVKARREEVTGILDTAVKENRMLPAQRESLLKAFGVEDDEKLMALDIETVKQFAAVGTPAKLPGQQGRQNPGDGSGTEERADQVLAQKAMAMSVEKDISYSAAAELVLKTEPQLAAAYRDYTLAYSEEGGAQ